MPEHRRASVKALATGRAQTDRHYPLQGPRAAIDDTEVGGSLLMLSLLSDQFRQDGRAGSEAIGGLLTLAASVLRVEVERPAELQ